MGVWGNEAAISVMLFAITFPLGLWFLAYHHYRRHGSFRGWSAVVTVVSFFYFAGLVAFTLFPLPDTNTAYCVAREGTSYWQFVPFASFGDVLAVAREVGPVGVLRTGVFLQVFFNVVLLVPLGALLAYRYRKSFAAAVLIGFGVSLLIEATQGTGVWGAFSCPYRLADVDDLITNTAGAGIGWLIGSVLSRYLPDATGEHSPDLDPPGVARRLFATAIDLVVFLLAGVVLQAIIIVISLWAGDGTVPDAVSAILPWAGSVVPGVVLFLIVPLFTRSRVTPGQGATWLAEVNRSPDLVAASPRQITIRFAVRWLPIIVGTFLSPFVLLAVVALYETATVAVRRDRRSLSSVAAGTMTITRRRLESHVAGAELLVNEARPSLQSRGFTDTEINEWALTYIAEEGNGDVDSFLSWMERVEQDR